MGGGNADQRYWHGFVQVKDATELVLDDIEPVELARQMTLLDYALFQTIRPSEYNNLAWTKKNKETISPNLLRFIRRFNEVQEFWCLSAKWITCWTQPFLVTLAGLHMGATNHPLWKEC